MFHDFFALFFNSDIHGYYTRQSDYLHVPQVKSHLSKFGIRYRGVIVWNALLKLGINPDTSEAVFSKTIKTCIKNNLLCIWSWYYVMCDMWCQCYLYMFYIYTYIYWYAKTTIFETKLLTAQYALWLNECTHYQRVRPHGITSLQLFEWWLQIVWQFAHVSLGPPCLFPCTLWC